MMQLIREPRKEAPDRVVVFDEYSRTRMIRTRRWKYVSRYPDGPDELYHMEDDPEEARNLIGQEAYADLVRELKAGMEQWFDTYTREETDGRKYTVTGSGQLRRCGEENAFEANLVYFAPH